MTGDDQIGEPTQAHFPLPAAAMTVTSSPVEAPRPLRIGFLGGALNSAVGYAHFVSCRMDARWSVEAGCFSREAGLNAETAAAYGVPGARTYADIPALLEAERGRLDAVAVLTPTPLHTDHVVMALDAGYPVISEKALATSSAEAAAIQAAVQRNRGFLAVTFNYSGYPMVRELRHLIRRGGLGEVKQIQIEMPQEGFIRLSAAGKPMTPQYWRLEDYTVPTISLDLGVHLHHLVHFLTGARPLEVMADQATQGNFAGIVDNVMAFAHYSDDLRVQFWYSKVALGYRNGLRVRVFGNKGSAEWHQMNPEFINLAYNDGSAAVLQRGAEGLAIANQARYNRFKAGHPAGFTEAFANLYRDIADLMLGRDDGSEDGPGSFVFGAEHAGEGLRLMECMAVASRTRAWQTVRGDDTNEA